MTIKGFIELIDCVLDSDVLRVEYNKDGVLITVLDR